MDQKHLIVVSIFTGRNFPRRSECSLIVEAQFNKEVLKTDPVPHVGETLTINTELAWELTKKSLQRHKLNRTPIKLQCFAVNKVTMAKQNVGYVMLDLRTAQNSQQKDPIWYGVLNSPYSRLKPQLLLSLSLEAEGEQTSQVKTRTEKPSALNLTLDPSGVFYQLGAEETSGQEMFTLSVTLQNAKHLPLLSPGQKQYYFYYSLLGNDITSEPFIPPTFPAERASIRIRSTRQTLLIFMASQQDVQIHLCCGSDSLGKGHLSLSSLKSIDRLDYTLPISIGKASIDVTIQLEQISLLSQKPHPHRQSPSTKMHNTPSGQTENPTSVPSAKRNLTQSFEDASLHPSPSTASPSLYIAPPTTTTSATPPDFMKVSPSPNADTKTPNAAPITDTRQPPPPTTYGSTPQYSDRSVKLEWVESGIEGKHVPIAHSSGTGFKPDEEMVPNSGIDPHVYGVVPSLTPSIPPAVDHKTDHALVTEGGVHPSASGSIVVPRDESSEHRHYKFSIDLRGMQNLTLTPGIKCYLRYNYSFFGCPYPVLVQPPVTLSTGSELRFSQSFCSFDFAASHQQLLHHTSHHPLVVEVWQSCDQTHDQIVGLSQVTLFEVFSQEKTMLESGASRQMHSLQPYITPPSSSSSSSHSYTPTLGQLNVVLVLEDHGPIGISNQVLSSKSNGSSGLTLNRTLAQSVPKDDIDHVTDPQSHATDPQSPVTSPQSHVTKSDSGDNQNHHGNHPNGHKKKGIMESSEYAVAMELEMWKMAEEEAFKEHLQSRESAHMTQLGEEWRRREAQRQQLLRQKLEYYSSLEKQLQEGLEKLQTQQKTLAEKELKLAHAKDKVAREQASFQESHEQSILNIRAQYEQKLEVERVKSSELQYQVESLKRQVRNLEVKVQTREAEFEKYREEMMIRPECKIQAELSIAQLEKAELERKLASLSKSKQHYKEQWSRALAELASSRQREQAAARNKLLTQQEELEAMRVQYFQQEQQNSLKEQISEVKKDVNRLQEHTLNSQTLSGHHQSRPQSPPPPHPQSKDNTQTTDLSTSVARWIEERDILLQTGVYTSTDPTIQKLDSKIRATMAQLKSL